MSLLPQQRSRRRSGRSLQLELTDDILLASGYILLTIRVDSLVTHGAW